MLSDDLIHKLVRENNETHWDWITWETLGNPAPKFRKGDVAMKLGLWRADYALLCRAGEKTEAKDHDDGALGRGWVKIDVLPDFNYNDHKELIATFLPFMQIDKDSGKLVEPTLKGASQGTYWLVLPYNYDDNSSDSKAVGTNLDVSKAVGSSRLTSTLSRWSTASRSNVVRVRDSIDTNLTTQDPWPYRTKQASVNIFGGSKQGNGYTPEDRKTTFAEALTGGNGSKFYSVKTGVQFVGAEDQVINKKDKLEANSLEAMRRSGLIDAVRRSYKADALQARYQIDILCVKIMAPEWDGFQVRHIATNPDEVWFPAHTISGSGKAFAKSWGKTGDWVAFWTANFAIPLGEAKGEMLALFGLQHQTANAQNMLIAFNRKGANAPASLCLILRDLGDTLLNDHAYCVLQEPAVDPKGLFKTAWEKELKSPGGMTLTHGEIGGGYSDPRMTRIGSAIPLFFPPFMEGSDLNDNATKTLSHWGLALNNAFLDYFTQNVGYTPEWQKPDPTQNLPDWHKTVEAKGTCADIMGPKDDYISLIKAVLDMHSKHRQGLIEYVSKRIKESDVGHKLARSFVALHDMLISGEVECYLKSDVGKANLRALHKKCRKS